jgi:PAS domain S-box-containing protein
MPDTISFQPPDPGLAARWGFDPETKRETLARFARLAQSVSQSSFARIILKDGAGFWSAGARDSAALEEGRAKSLADLIAGIGERRWTEDASRCPEIRDNGLVTGKPFIRLSAWAPIVMSDGQSIGGLYIGDASPRAHDPKIAEALENLADLVAQACERPRLQRDLANAAAEAAATAKVLADFVQCSPVALYMTDRRFRILHASPRWLFEMGLEGVEVVGKTVWDVFPGAFERHSAVFDRVMAGETVRLERAQLVLPDGRRPWVRTALTAWREANGEIGGLLCMSHDITDMVEALDESERSKRRLKLAAEMADIHVFEMDYVTRTLAMDGAFKAFFEEPKTYADFWKDPTCGVHPDDVERVRATWGACQAEGRPFRAEYRVPPVRGKEVWAFAGCDLVTDSAGRPTSMIGVLQNITARKASELALTQARDSAEAANRAKSEFLANMSHEIRTPLNGVMGVAGALARTELSDAQRDMVRLIETSAQTLENLLSDVLDLARIESGRLTLTRSAFSMDEVVRPVAALFEPNARGKGLDFHMHLPDEALGVFVGDAARIRQILSNLVSNAVKFTAKGGVSLGVAAEPAGQAVRFRFTVADTGIGFDAETQKRLFERFEQADGSITRRYGGTGLGLAISRSLAEEMSGALTASAVLGQGACFSFEVALPRAEATAIAPTAAASGDRETAGSGLSPRVLLAEDHPTNRRVIELILAAVDVRLTSVENGQEALDAFASQTFDLVLMDMQMPVMDGLTAIRAIREQEAEEGRPRTPIYALTANAMPEHVEASRLAGADAHLTKPIAAEALIAAVRQIALASDRAAAERTMLSA